MKNIRHWRWSTRLRNCSIVVILLLFTALLSVTACRSDAQEAWSVRIWIRVACNTPVCGIRVEYEVDRGSAGEMGISAVSGMSRALPEGDTVSLDIPIDALPEGLAPVSLCLRVYIITADRVERSVPYQLEWSAERSRFYRFTLLGDVRSGFEIEPDTAFSVVKGALPQSDEAPDLSKQKQPQ